MRALESHEIKIAAFSSIFIETSSMQNFVRIMIYDSSLITLNERELDELITVLQYVRGD